MTTWDDQAQLYRASIDDRVPAGRQLISRCLVAADLKIRNAAGHQHAVVNYIAHVVTLTDKETGEQFQKVRLVLVRDDGKTISTVSEPTIKAFAYLASKLGPGPYNPPVQVYIVEIPLGEGRSYCTLHEVADIAAEAKPTKRQSKDS